MTPLQSRLLESASLAPSPHNTQPWLLRFQNDSLELWANRDRMLPAADPKNADLLHAVGAALENCLLTLEHHGQLGSYVCADTFGLDRPIIQLTWSHSPNPPQTTALYRQIPLRQTSRRPFDARPLTPEIVQRLTAAVHPPFVLRIETQPDAVRRIREIASGADVTLMGDPGMSAEFYRWMRFKKKEARWFLDGLNAECMNWSAIEAWVARYLLRPKPLAALHRLHLSRLLFGQVNQQAPQTPAIALLSWKPDSNDSLGGRIEAGRQLERLWLTAAADSLCTHPLSSAVDLAESRQKIFEHFGVAEGEQHVSLFRIGHAPRTPRSYRLMADALLQPPN
jgi:hypothetical protein